MIYAHRGIHNKFIPENSLISFFKCKNKNIGIELDVRIIKTGEIVVFHDSNLKRMTGIDKKIEELELKELNEITLLNTKYKIPLLIDVLNLINNEVPILIEIKSKNKKIVKKLIKILNNYENYKIQSFNKKILNIYKKYHKVGLLSYKVNNDYDFLVMPNYLINDLTIKKIKTKLFIWNVKLQNIKKYKKYTDTFIVDYD